MTSAASSTTRRLAAVSPASSVTPRERWQPDDQLIAAVRCGNGSRRMSDLQDADRSWVVAGLTLAGLTAEDIADRLCCSLRSVRSVRAAAMTQVCLIYQREVLAFANQMALADSDVRGLRRDLAEALEDRNRLKAQLDRVIDARLTGEQVDVCGRGHLMVDWNTYWHNGRRWCRECHAERQRDYRLARKLDMPARLIREARDNGELDTLVKNVLATTSMAESEHALRA